MKIRSVVMAMLMLSGSLVFAQVYPPTCPPTSSGTVCLVPSRNAQGTCPTATCPTSPTAAYPGVCSTSPTAVCPSYPTAVYPSYPTAVCPSYPTAVCPSYPTAVCPSYPTAVCPTYPTAAFPGSVTVPYSPSTGMAYYPNLTATGVCQSMPMGTPSGCACSSPDTACLLNELEALRSDIRSTRAQIKSASLQLQGQVIIGLMNRLMNEEQAYRQGLAANPHLTGAQVMAMGLQYRVNEINQQITAFNQELSMIPPDQRSFLACDLNTFDTAYWTPAMQRFASYTNQFIQNACTVYQPLYAANPWLQSWQTSFQTALNTISTAPQTYASARWWAMVPTVQGSTVLGTTEVFQPGSQIIGSVMMLPTGNTVFVPSGSVPMASASSSVCGVYPAPAAPTAMLPPSPSVAGTVETAPAPTPAAPPTTRGEARGAY